MYWLLLILAGLFETGFAFCLAQSHKYTGTWHYIWLAAFLVCLTISMYLLMYVTKYISMGTAYAVWTGIGAVGTVIVGLCFFKEPISFWRIFFLSSLILSVVGLKWAASQ